MLFCCQKEPFFTLNSYWIIANVKFSPDFSVCRDLLIALITTIAGIVAMQGYVYLYAGTFLTTFHFLFVQLFENMLFCLEANSLCILPPDHQHVRAIVFSLLFRVPVYVSDLQRYG